MFIRTRACSLCWLPLEGTVGHDSSEPSQVSCVISPSLWVTYTVRHNQQHTAPEHSGSKCVKVSSVFRYSYHKHLVLRAEENKLIEMNSIKPETDPQAAVTTVGSQKNQAGTVQVFNFSLSLNCFGNWRWSAVSFHLITGEKRCCIIAHQSKIMYLSSSLAETQAHWGH